MIEHFPILVVVIPLLTSFLTPVLGLFRRGLCFWLCLASALLTLCVATGLLGIISKGDKIRYPIGGWEPPYGIEYVIDRLSAVMILLVAFVGFLAVIYSKQSVKRELAGQEVPFYTLFLLLLASLLSICATGDLFNFYVFLEIAALSAYALISIGERREALVASFNYLILGTLAACSVLMAIGFLYAVTGSLNMLDVSERLKGLYDSRVVHAAAILMVVGLSLKIALFPLHLWLPDAYAHAPSVVSAFIASLMSKVGIYAMLRILFDVFTVEFFEVIPIADVLVLVASVAIVAGGICALAQDDVKRMLAYSSVSNIGYMVLGVGLANELGLMGSLLHILSHAFMKGSLFFAAGAVVYKLGARMIRNYEGLSSRMPYTSLAFGISALCSVGVPPAGAFFSKLFLILGALEKGDLVPAVAILAGSLLSAGYFFRVLERAYFGRFPPLEAEEAPMSMMIPTFVLAIGSLAFGVLLFLFAPYLREIALLLLS